MFVRTYGLHCLESSQTGIAISRAYLLLTYYNNLTYQPWRTHDTIYSPSYLNVYLGCIFHRTYRQHYYGHTFRHVQPHKSNHCCSSSWRRVYRHWPHQSILGRLFPFHVSLIVLCYNIYTLQPWSYLCFH